MNETESDVKESLTTPDSERVGVDDRRLVRPRFFRKAFAKERFHIFDREVSETVPLHDDAPGGGDRPIILGDDASFEWVQRSNA